MGRLQYAEAFKKSIEEYYSRNISYVENNISITEIVKTEVILDFTPTIPEVAGESKPREFFAKLILFDCVSTIKNNKKDYVPGFTKRAINAFEMNLAVSLDGKLSDMNEFENVSQHEAGHSAGLNHPWELNEIEQDLLPEINQKSESFNFKIVLDNIMNSMDNDVIELKSNSGSKILDKQFQFMINNINDKKRYSPQQLISSDPEKERSQNINSLK